MLTKVKELLNSLLCDTNSKNLSLGRTAFISTLLLSFFHYKDFTAEWCALLAALLAYCYGNKKVETPGASEAT